MANLTVVVVGAPDYARDLGKRSTASDMTFFDIKRGEATVTFVEPTKYPERLSTLFHCASMADAALVVVDQISPVLGETIVMLDCVGVRRGWMVLRNYITVDQLAPFVRGTALEAYEVVQDDHTALREMLLAEAEKAGGQEPEGPSRGSVPVDHHFDVKGVGTVVLGRVADGHIRKHDSLRVLPDDKRADIRSIQKHDDDFDWAVKGDRVGLALKGITAQELDRGAVLTTDPALVARNELTCVAEVVKYWLNPIAEGMVLHVGHWMQFVPARVAGVSDTGDRRRPRLSLSLQKPLAFPPGSKAVLAYLEGGKLRVVGTALLE
ncbi:MAG: EF-Tu/IF-2/RF-3 family GTPase [Candidatus Thermoplasmatota archaeon]